MKYDTNNVLLYWYKESAAYIKLNDGHFVDVEIARSDGMFSCRVFENHGTWTRQNVICSVIR